MTVSPEQVAFPPGRLPASSTSGVCATEVGTEALISAFSLLPFGHLESAPGPGKLSAWSPLLCSEALTLFGGS